MTDPSQRRQCDLLKLAVRCNGANVVVSMGTTYLDLVSVFLL